MVVTGFCKNAAACDCSSVCHAWAKLEVIQRKEEFWDSHLRDQEESKCL